MENKPAKRLWKLNIFDAVLIAVVIIAACALLIVWRQSGKSSAVDVNTKPVHYTIELTGIKSGITEEITEGDIIVDSTKKIDIGTVVSVNIIPSVTPVKDLETGDTLLSEIPGEETALITVVCNCSETDAQISTESGYVIRVGSSVSVSGPGYAGTGYIVAIEREDLET